MIWQNFKNKIIDFFYKEVEVEEDEELNDSYGSVYGTEKYRLSTLEDTPSEAKVRYQYPKRSTNSFRFPVIPDETEPSHFKGRTAIKRKKESDKRVKEETLSDVLQQNELHEVKHQRKDRELEEVPAFMRRESVQKENKSISQNERMDTEQKQVDSPVDIQPHTKPDELDAIFKKRDGHLHSRVESAPTLSHESNEQDFNIAYISEEKLEQEPLDDNNLKVTEENQVISDIEEPNKTINPDPSPAVQSLRNETVIKDEKQTNFKVQKENQRVQPKEATQLAPSIPDYLLNDHPNESSTDDDWLIEQQILLEDTFTHFNIDATVVNVTQGPSVTRFEIQPALGVKVSKIKNLSDDLKLNLAAEDIRIEAPIPGKNTIGIEIPNQTMHLVNLQDIFEADSFKQAVSPLTVALGLTIEGTPIITDIDKMPHGLIAGATGSGKSVCINTIILSLLYKAHHNDVKLLLVDPKMVELTPYNNIPHLIAPVITDVKAATKALKWAVDEMEDRYRKFVELGVRNIQKYNEKIKHQETHYEKMPYIVIIIDELADLMMMSPQEVEDAICRIAQKARACGIHLLLATQRPSVDVITGLIKANIPTRIAFSVSSQVDSRTMLDSSGAEKLLGKGDMLFVENGAGKALRLQGPFVSDEEIERVASYVRSIAEPEYLFEEEQLLTTANEEEDADELLEEVIRFIVSKEQASTSLLQRQFRIGYNRAARLIDSLEAKGIISGQNGSKPREVLVSEEQLEYI